MTVQVTLATEGVSDQQVPVRLIVGAGLLAGDTYGRRGEGQLDQQLARYNAAAMRQPWVVLHDLDADESCPGALCQRLLPQPAALMCLRIAVRSVEAWLLADRQAFGDYFKVRQASLPKDVEGMQQPKRTMLEILSSASPALRDALVRRSRQSSVAIGPEYNSLLAELRREAWRPDSAGQDCRSLTRKLNRLVAFSEPLRTRQ